LGRADTNKGGMALSRSNDLYITRKGKIMTIHVKGGGEKEGNKFSAEKKRGEHRGEGRGEDRGMKGTGKKVRPLEVVREREWRK